LKEIPSSRHLETDLDNGRSGNGGSWHRPLELPVANGPASHTVHSNAERFQRDDLGHPAIQTGRDQQINEPVGLCRTRFLNLKNTQHLLGLDAAMFLLVARTSS
jgi:hypothetical protein